MIHMAPRRSANPMLAASTPSITTLPASNSVSRNSACKHELFPAPVRPTIAVRLPAGHANDTWRSAGLVRCESVGEVDPRRGYLMTTSRNSTRPWCGQLAGGLETGLPSSVVTLGPPCNGASLGMPMKWSIRSTRDNSASPLVAAHITIRGSVRDVPRGCGWRQAWRRTLFNKPADDTRQGEQRGQRDTHQLRAAT